MTLLNVDELREHIATSLVDAALQRLLDDAEAAIVQFAGPVATVTELVDGGGSTIVLSRPVDLSTDVATVIERSTGFSPITVAVDDWALRGRFVLERLRTGTNGAGSWRGPVSVTYTPADDTATREVVQVELCRIEIAFN